MTAELSSMSQALHKERKISHTECMIPTMSSGSHPIAYHNLPETGVMDEKGLFIHSYALGTEEK